VDFLAETGQRWWQILPLGPTGFGNSPYQSHSSFAGNRLLIDPDGLVEREWLRPEDMDDRPPAAPDRVDFERVSATKDRWLELAFQRFDNGSPDPGFEQFLEATRFWLPDYVLYHALKDAHGGRPWYEWEPKLVARDSVECARWSERLADRIRFHEFLQFVFETQWQSLRDYCRRHGVTLIGDLPIFVAHDSAEVWARPELFYLNKRRQPLVVAGVPPDYFSETGQLWGNPLYRWKVHAREGYSWWVDRIRFLLGRVDLIRIDHFRGFEAYWEIPAGSPTAATGRWAKGPGRPFFRSLRRQLGSLPLIAEDLGVITPAVEALRDEFGLPGMRVLQFGFGADPGAEIYLPHGFVPHCVAYTGTHDNDTTLGWLTSTDVSTTQSPAELKAERAFVRRYVDGVGGDFHWEMIRLAHASVADTAIIPMQDILGLDSRARMNRPGCAEGNWMWRFQWQQLGTQERAKLAEITAVYGRWNGPVPAELDPRFRPPPQYKPASPESSPIDSNQ